MTTTTIDRIAAVEEATDAYYTADANGCECAIADATSALLAAIIAAHEAGEPVWRIAAAGQILHDTVRMLVA